MSPASTRTRPATAGTARASRSVNRPKDWVDWDEDDWARAAADGEPRRPAEPAGHRRWPWLLGTALLVLVLGAAAWVIWFSSLLALRTVDVVGSDQTTAAAVRVAMADHYGTPLARIDPAGLAARIEQLPLVESAEVVRQWPDTLVVTAHSRTAVAVTAANGSWWLLDHTGLPFQEVEAPPAGLLTVELATPGPADPATVAALEVVAAMTADFRAQVTAVSAPSPHAIVVRLADDREVIWGGVDDSVRKMQILPALLAQPGTVFDISDPALVTTR